MSVRLRDFRNVVLDMSWHPGSALSASWEQLGLGTFIRSLERSIFVYAHVYVVIITRVVRQEY